VTVIDDCERYNWGLLFMKGWQAAPRAAQPSGAALEDTPRHPLYLKELYHDSDSMPFAFSPTNHY